MNELMTYTYTTMGEMMTALFNNICETTYKGSDYAKIHTMLFDKVKYGKDMYLVILTEDFSNNPIIFNLYTDTKAIKEFTDKQALYSNEFNFREAYLVTPAENKYVVIGKEALMWLNVFDKWKRYKINAVYRTKDGLIKDMLNFAMPFMSSYYSDIYYDIQNILSNYRGDYYFIIRDHGTDLIDVTSTNLIEAKCKIMGNGFKKVFHLTFNFDESCIGEKMQAELKEIEVRDFIQGILIKESAS